MGGIEAEKPESKKAAKKEQKKAEKAAKKAEHKGGEIKPVLQEEGSYQKISWMAIMN